MSAVESEQDDLIAKRRGEPPSRELVKEAIASSNKILPGLVIGSAHQCEIAGAHGYHCLSVRNEPCAVERCNQLPFLDLDTFLANKAHLDRFADALKASWGAGQKTYVHCFFGIERAPLAVAYAIKRDVTPQMTFEEVYAFVRCMRAVALDRTSWLGPIQ